MTRAQFNQLKSTDVVTVSKNYGVPHHIGKEAKVLSVDRSFYPSYNHSLYPIELRINDDLLGYWDTRVKFTEIDYRKDDPRFAVQ